jgi:hypothetical protein
MPPPPTDGLHARAGFVVNPQREHVGGAGLGGDADLLAVEVLERLDGRVRQHQELPAMRRRIDRRDDLLLGALAHRQPDAGAEIGDDVGRARA